MDGDDDDSSFSFFFSGVLTRAGIVIDVVSALSSRGCFLVSFVDVVIDNDVESCGSVVNDFDLVSQLSILM